jgi:hypothetical protein
MVATAVLRLAPGVLAETAKLSAAAGALAAETDSIAGTASALAEVK